MSIAAAQVGSSARVSDQVVQGGISCELVHLGSLYHDDVMDESTLRRGVETVNAKWGNLQAILAGDFLLARASEIAASLGTEVAGLLARTIGRLCEGQIEELQHTYDTNRTVESYLASIDGKTASLFSAAARIGGIVAGHDRDVIEALTSYGTSYGIVFQIVDDILDIVSTDDELGKPAGHDMEEGVYTLPVLLTMQAGGAAAEKLRTTLGEPLSAQTRTELLQLVRSGDGVERAVNVAKEYVAMAEATCALMPASSATTALRDAAGALLTTISN
jgi:heptaprenyl diphosphate synthase